MSRRCLDCYVRYQPGHPSRCPTCATQASARIEAARTRPSAGVRYPAIYWANRKTLLSNCTAETVCALCGKRLTSNRRAWTADHIVPVSHGGSHDLANLQPAHAACNSGRGNR